MRSLEKTNASRWMRGIFAHPLAHVDRLRSVLLLGIAVTGVMLLYLWIK